MERNPLLFEHWVQRCDSESGTSARAICQASPLPAVIEVPAPSPIGPLGGSNTFRLSPRCTPAVTTLLHALEGLKGALKSRLLWNATSFERSAKATSYNINNNVLRGLCDTERNKHVIAISFWYYRKEPRLRPAGK